MLIDIGVNLTASAFAKDLDAVIERAQQAGVGRMVVTGTCIEHSEQALRLNQQYPQLLVSTAGVHPHHASDWNPAAMDSIWQLSQQASVVAIGECGLDYNRNYSSPDAQRRCFEAQLELAAELQLPVFLHQRDAHEDFVAILSRWLDRLDGAVAHCFTGGRDQARAYVDLGLSLGITGWICDERRGVDLQRAVRDIPDDRLMIETDAPYLLPRDLDQKPRERRNEPMYLPHICRALARYRDDDSDRLARLTTDNARRFFKLGE